MNCYTAIAALITISIGIYTYVKWKFNYWKRMGVPYIEPTFPFGTLENPLTRKYSIGILLKLQYDFFKKQGHKHGGLYFFTSTSYLPIHPDCVKNIMTKDFNHFNDRGIYYNEKDDPLSANIFKIEGHKWRKLRIKFTPTFTSSKMKMMFPTLVSCSDPMVSSMDEFAKSRSAVNIKDLSSSFTIDVIGSCGFGLDCNSFKDPNSEFRKYGKEIVSPVSKLKFFKLALAISKPNLGRMLGITVTPDEAAKFFLKTVKDTVEYRENNNVSRKDFMQILIDLKNNVDVDNSEAKNKDEHLQEKLTIEQVAAQAFLFFLAGFDTSAVTMTFCLFELGLNQDIQDKVRQEVLQILEDNNGELTYDGIMKMKYLGQAVDETLRKYPPIAAIPRRCVEDYQVPNSDLVVKKGTRVFIPVMGLHYDSEYFPDPEKFDPERFNDDSRKNIPPYTYIPFGEGPRNCIAARFGLMQTRVGLAVLLKNFRFSISDKTVLPVTFNAFSAILCPQNDIWLNVEKI